MDAPVTTPPTPGESPQPTARRSIGRWPFGLLAIVVLRLIDAAILAAIGLEMRGLPINGLPILGGNPDLTRVVDLVFVILTVAGLVGLLLFQRWGWVLTMVLVGISLLGDLIRVAIGDPGYLGLLLHVLTAFYLNGRAVRALASDEPAVERGLAP